MDRHARLLENLGRKHIPGLDGIRGIAALSVVAGHGWSGRFPMRFAVYIFLIISGFLITWLLLQERQGSGSINRKAFYYRRALRLLPALLGLLLWESITEVPAVSRAGITAAALYYANYYQLFTGGGLLGLDQTWSLSVEEHFYFIWPQVLPFVRNSATLLKGCFVVAGIETVWRLIAGYFGHYDYAEIATETASSAALIGCGLALMLWQCPARLPKFVLQPWVGVISIIAVLALAQLPREAQLWYGVPLGIPFEAIIVLQAISFEWPLLENPVARYLGRISYGIYLWCNVAIAIAQHFKHAHLLLMFTAAIALASLSYYLIERPIRRLGHRNLIPITPALEVSP